MYEVLLGVTGGAAAFKACILGSLMRKEGYRVNTILTSGALRFITPIQISSVTGGPCYTRLFNEDRPDFIPHISLTDNADLMVIAPATANFLGRAASGIADDLLTSAFLACEAPVLVAPAMNTRMWSNHAVKHNMEVLLQRGVSTAGPVKGELACGTTGTGRMMEPEDIFSICKSILKAGG